MVSTAQRHGLASRFDRPFHARLTRCDADGFLARFADLEPPATGQRDHADQRLRIEFGQLRVESTGLELGAEDVFDLVRDVVEDAGEVAAWSD